MQNHYIPSVCHRSRLVGLLPVTSDFIVYHCISSTVVRCIPVKLHRQTL